MNEAAKTANPAQQNVAMGKSWPERARRYRSFVIFTAAYLLIVQISVCVLTIPAASRGAADFRQLYTAGYMARSGHAGEIYDYDTSARIQSQIVSREDGALPFNHLGYEALVFVPLSLLKFRTAYFTFFAVNLALLAICLRLLRLWLKSTEDFWIELQLVPFLCFYPVTIALIQGQDSIVLLTLMVAAFVSLERRRYGSAGFWLGLTAFKFQFTLPLLVLLLAWRRWKAAAFCALTGLTVAGCSIAITGGAVFSAYLRSLASLGQGVAPGTQQRLWAIHPEAMPNLRGLASVLSGAQDPHNLARWAVIGGTGLLLIWAARQQPSFPLAVAVALLVGYHGLIHDAAILVLPVCVLATKIQDPDPSSRGWAVLAAAALVITPTLLFLGHLSYSLMVFPIFATLAWLRIARNGLRPA